MRLPTFSEWAFLIFLALAVYFQIRSPDCVCAADAAAKSSSISTSAWLFVFAIGTLIAKGALYLITWMDKGI